MSVSNIMSLGVYLIKTAPHHSWRVCLIQRQSHVIFSVRFERRKVDKNANLHENLNICSRVF